MKPPLSHAPLLPVVTALTAGILADRYVADPHIVCALAIGASIICLIFKKIYPGAILVAAGVGIILNQAHTPTDEIPPGEHHRATVISVSEATMSNRVVADIEGYGRTYLTVPTRFTPPRPGDFIEFAATLAEPKQRRDINTEYDLENFFYRNYITSAGTVTECRVVGHSHSLRWRAADLRAHLTDIIVNGDISDTSKEFLTALLLGDNSMMPEITTKKMSKAGLSHILALSGLHVAIIAFLLGMLLFPLAWGDINLPRYIILLILLWTYAFITGLSPSVTRAVIMVSVALTGRMTGRNGTTFNSLCFAIIILITADPRIIYAPGFQLTVVAVAAICLIPRLLPELTTESPLKRMIIYWLIFSISAVVGTSLLSVYYFHTFPVYFLLANIPIALTLPLLLGCGLFFIISGCVGLHFNILDRFIDLLCQIINFSAEATTSLPGSYITDVYLNTHTVILGYISLILLGTAIYYRNKMTAAAGCAVIVIFTLTISGNSRPDELFIARNHNCSTIVIADENGIKARTTASYPSDKDAIGSLPTFYPNFFGMHGYDSATTVEDGDGGTRWKATGRIIATPEATIAIINSDSDTLPYHGYVTYALIGGGYKADMQVITGALHPDTILLGTDIHPRRMKRFSDELEALNQPYRSLKDPYGLHIEF